MMPEPDVLLDGPRGRRLCLEYLPELLEGGDVGRMLADVLDVSATRTDRLVLRDPDPSRLFDVLQFAVDVARYWQPPDDDDVRAADPALRPVLRRVAERILATGEASWWGSSVSVDDQWAVAFDDPLRAARDPEPEAAEDLPSVLDSWRATALEDEVRMQHQHAGDPRTAVSAGWWSIPPWGPLRSTRARGEIGPVGLRLGEDSFGPDRAKARAVAVPSGLRVFEIDGPDAWTDLCRRFPFDVSASRRVDWFGATGRRGRWVVPDWSLVGRSYDGVHLSVLGYLLTAGRVLPVDLGDEAAPDRTIRGSAIDTHTGPASGAGTGTGAASVLAGWGPDETVWFTDRVQVVGPVEQWERDVEGEHNDAWFRPVTVPENRQARADPPLRFGGDRRGPDGGTPGGRR